jgi:hypothetical protein
MIRVRVAIAALAAAANPDAARALLDLSPPAIESIRSKGMEPG